MKCLYFDFWSILCSLGEWKYTFLLNNNNTDPKLLNCRVNLSLSESFNKLMTDWLIIVKFHSHPCHSLQLFFNFMLSLSLLPFASILKICISEGHSISDTRVSRSWSDDLPAVKQIPQNLPNNIRACAQLLNEGSKIFGWCNLRPGPVLFILLKRHRVQILVTLSALVEPKLGLQTGKYYDKANYRF